MKTRCTFLNTSCSFFIEWEIFWTKVVEKIKHTSCSITFFFFVENCAVYEIIWKNVVEWGRAQMTIWCMCIACWIPKATNTHSEYVIITDFSIVTSVARRRLNVKLYVHCLSCCILLMLMISVVWTRRWRYVNFISTGHLQFHLEACWSISTHICYQFIKIPKLTHTHICK